MYAIAARLCFTCLTALIINAAIISVAISDDNKSDQLEDVIKQGRAKAQNCTRCHGRDGMAHLVKQAGWEQSVSTYVIKQLLLFRGQRVKHEIMNTVAAPLSDTDIYEIALWYESVSKK